MKKLLAVFLLMALMLTACSKASSGVYEVDGLRLRVDWDQYTIGDGQYIYNYTREKTGSVDKIVITYPNGVQYYVNGMDGQVLFIRAYQPGDISEYISPEILYAAIDDQKPVFQDFNGFYVLALIFGVGIIMVGIIFVVSPKSVWKMVSNCYVKKGASTDRALPEIAFRGVLIIASGLLLIVTVIVCAFN